MKPDPAAAATALLGLGVSSALGDAILRREAKRAPEVQVLSSMQPIAICIGGRQLLRLTTAQAHELASQLMNAAAYVSAAAAGALQAQEDDDRAHVAHLPVD